MTDGLPLLGDEPDAFSLRGSAYGQAWVLGLAFEHDALSSAVPGVNNPITDVWAPLGGRTFNLGIKVP
ncbi:MAG: hypothetical protein ACLP2F_06615 [Steroidobacteraceae bacterium]